MNKKISEKSNDGVSPVIATIILVAITVIMCGLFAAFVMPFINELDERPNEILEIQFIESDNPSYKSNITVKNIGRELLVNSDYKPVIYINNVQHFLREKGGATKPEINKLSARGEGTGFSNISGEGPNGDVWLPGAIGYFDLTNDAIKQSYVVQVDIIRKSDGKLFSRSVRSHIYNL